MRRLAIALVLIGAVGAVGACRAERTVLGAVGDDQWQTLAPSPWQVRLPARDPTDLENPTVLEIARTGTDQILARGSRAVGSTLAFTDAGRACTLHVDRPYEYTKRAAPGSLEHPRPQDVVVRTYRGIVVTGACGARPVPGTEADQPGARALRFVPWFALLVALGAAVTALAGRDRVGLAFAAAASAVGAIAAIAWLAYGPGYLLGAVVGLAGAGALGCVLGEIGRDRPRGAAVSGAIGLAALTGFASAVDPWSELAPIGGAVIAAAAAAAALIGVALLPSRPA